MVIFFSFLYVYHILSYEFKWYPIFHETKTCCSHDGIWLHYKTNHRNGQRHPNWFGFTQPVRHPKNKPLNSSTEAKTNHNSALGWLHTWVNYNISLTWIEAIWGWFPLLTMIPVRSQWGRYNLPRNICFSAVLLATLSYPRLHEGLPHPAAKLGYEYLSKQRQVKSHQIMLII